MDNLTAFEEFKWFKKKESNPTHEEDSHLSFKDDEILKLKELGFHEDGENGFVFNTKINKLVATRNKVSYDGISQKWYTLMIKYDPFIDHAMKNPEYFQDFKWGSVNTEHEQYDDFDELIDNIKIYMK